MSDLNSLSFDQLVPKNSNYLSKEEVGEDGAILTIDGFKSEIIKTENGEEEKVVLYFKEEGVKPMVINRTNAQLLRQVTGATTAGEACGKQIVVYNDPSIQFAGKITGGIRIKRIPGAPKAARTTAPPRGPAATRAAASPVVPIVDDEELNDRIPF